ncbi:carbamoyl-phosphate synthase, small subunit [Kwoniella dejecticola CBS 10117]|uniref:Carbamoyl phosphate synthase arginine-specific small chain n=1 Tax=Kwoniella dejecticola CBS 10117 TaxID=1296121 RepID=A0A1A6ACS9_9TREE|nr:carbamoyl-phosphate synthase, small subunit [Kwoniella dejecticola CBS 10117]OBR87861.1 carbamoyl-phosphate synthase, small subunit [Kwoniella dejecticola CBS 10117]
MSIARSMNAIRASTSALKSSSSSSLSLPKRTLATPVNTNLYTPVLPAKIPAALHLKSGQSYYGQNFGSETSKFGETVFSTSITSYTDSMTDPSYLGQILVFTSPMIGNYGVPSNSSAPGYPGIPFLESEKIQCTGVVVSDVALKYSHYQAVESLHEWCHRHDVPGITGVDTRAITTLLRDQGTTLGRLAVGDEASKPAPSDGEYWDPSVENLVAQASTKQPYTINAEGKGPKIALLDFGTKANILRSLVKRGAQVTVLPWDYDFNSIRDQFDGLFLSNGPGDPKQIMETAYRVRTTIDEWDKPIFGICMGHQVLGLAAGLEAYRMTFGNRGHNQPVLALASSGSISAGRVYVTSQNHQYALKLTEDFPEGWAPFFINCNDSSVEGIISTPESGKRVWGVQFHPESAGGPLDTIEMFTDFVNECQFGRAGGSNMIADEVKIGGGDAKAAAEISASI